MKTILRNDNSQTSKKRNRRSTLNLMVVMTFMLQLILPVGLHVSAMPGSEGQGEDQTGQVQITEDPKKAVEAQNDEDDKVDEVESKEEPKVVEEKKEEPKAVEEKKEEPKAVEEKKEEPKAVEEKKEEPKVVEEKKEESSPSKTDEVDDKTEEVVESEELEEDIDDVEEEKEVDEIIDPEAEGYDGEDPNGLFALAPLVLFAEGSLGSAASMNNRSLNSRSMNNELQPGEVRTSKKATPVPGMVNTWDIEVLIEGRDAIRTETTDVVLVIDRSGSMEGQQMLDAQNAANEFIETMINRDPNLRIGLVSFARDASLDHNFSRNITSLQSEVDDLNATGGTHTQAGILQGRALINGSTADNQFIVLLSDGMPTYSYEPKNWETTPISYNNRNYYPGIYDGQYNNTRVGTGNSIDRYYTRGTHNNDSSGDPYRRYINNGDAAIRAAFDTKNSGIDGLYTIAVSAGQVGTDILEQISSPGKDFSTNNSGDLPAIYDEIAGQISSDSAIKDATIIDEMGDGFSLVNGSIVTTEGTTVVAAASGSNNETITWTIYPEVTTYKAGSTTIREAKMTYRVEINPDILTAPVATPGITSDHDLFKTNKSTVLNYKDASNNNQTKYFVSPEVDPVLLKIKKILKDEAGNIVNQDPRLFNVQITSGSVFDHTEDLVVGADYEILTTLRYEGTYNVEEISITGASGTDLSHFNISYNIDGSAGTNFVVNHNGAIPRGDIVIEVTNEAIAQDVDFTFKKVDSSGNPLLGSEFTLETIVGGQTVFIDNIGVDPIFTFAGLGEGSYTLTETKAPAGYRLPTRTWTIEVVRNQTTGLLEIIIPDDSFLTSDEEGNNVENEEQNVFPQTGGIGGLSYIVAGLTILTSSLGLYVRKEEKVEE